MGDRVVVLGSATLPAPAGGGRRRRGRRPATAGRAGLCPAWGAATTTMTTVDVSDPRRRPWSATHRGGGRLRLGPGRATGVVRVVTTSTPVLPFVDPWLLQQERAAAEGVAADDPSLAVEPDAAAGGRGRWPATSRSSGTRPRRTGCPTWSRRDAAGTVTSTEPVACDAVAHPGEGVGHRHAHRAHPGPRRGRAAAGHDVGERGRLARLRLHRPAVRGHHAAAAGPGGAGPGEPVSTELHGFATTSPQTTRTWAPAASTAGCSGPGRWTPPTGTCGSGTTERRPLVAGGAGHGAGGGGADLSLPAPPPGEHELQRRRAARDRRRPGGDRPGRTASGPASRSGRCAGSTTSPSS